MCEETCDCGMPNCSECRANRRRLARDAALAADDENVIQGILRANAQDDSRERQIEDGDADDWDEDDLHGSRPIDQP